MSGDSQCISIGVSVAMAPEDGVTAGAASPPGILATVRKWEGYGAGNAFGCAPLWPRVQQNSGYHQSSWIPKSGMSKVRKMATSGGTRAHSSLQP